jgi:hypothetical protein
VIAVSNGVARDYLRRTRAGRFVASAEARGTERAERAEHEEPHRMVHTHSSPAGHALHTSVSLLKLEHVSHTPGQSHPCGPVPQGLSMHSMPSGPPRVSTQTCPGSHTRSPPEHVTGSHGLFWTSHIATTGA